MADARHRRRRQGPADADEQHLARLALDADQEHHGRGGLRLVHRITLHSCHKRTPWGAWRTWGIDTKDRPQALHALVCCPHWLTARPLGSLLGDAWVGAP